MVETEQNINDQHHDIIGNSPQMTGIFSLIEKVAQTSVSVLITGESGTGKELAARSIHKNSKRFDKPFIIIDCAALSEHLLENELFGHEKGAFTDATSMKRGLFEVADGGTLFIDEIGEMNLVTQAKLLRVIETHQFRRLGSTQQITVDVRIVAATNRKIEEEVKTNNFREDLYYRLNVFRINLPSLRERKEDIPLLARHFITNSKASSIKKRIREEDIKILTRYDWPGNVRELANAIEHAITISSNEYIAPEDFPLSISAHIPNTVIDINNKSLDKLVEDYEKGIILGILKKCDNNKMQVAKLLGLSRSKLYRKLNQYHLL